MWTTLWKLLWVSFCTAAGKMSYHHRGRHAGRYWAIDQRLSRMTFNPVHRGSLEEVRLWFLPKPHRLLLSFSILPRSPTPTQGSPSRKSSVISQLAFILHLSLPQLRCTQYKSFCLPWWIHGWACSLCYLVILVPPWVGNSIINLKSFS